MKLSALIASACLALAVVPAQAADFACPDLAGATQVNACPTEEELKHTYSGFCGDDKKAYSRETDNCVRYKDYRAMKNTALWESQDGEFSAYVSCDLAPAKLKLLKAKSMKIERQGTLNKVVCTYPNGIAFTYRTKSACRMADEKACAANAADCRASCD